MHEGSFALFDLLLMVVFQPAIILADFRCPPLTEKSVGFHQGLVGVRFFKQGRWMDVAVDTTIPCLEVISG